MFLKRIIAHFRPFASSRLYKFNYYTLGTYTVATTIEITTTIEIIISIVVVISIVVATVLCTKSLHI